MDSATSLSRRRRLRLRSTYAEAALWSYLRGRRVAGFKFRRRYSCGPFILAFFCARRRLGIELDRGQHHDPRARAHDHRRTAYLAAHRVTVLRFPCDQILPNPASVLTVICFALGVEGGSAFES
jgi:very-short-patch-repair endonuclease